MVSTKFISALALAFVAVYAGNDNAFISPGLGNVGNANSALSIKWTPSTSGAINLVLRGGDQNDLTTILTIASNIPNSGSYEWSIPATVTSATSYTIEIQDAADTTNVNYSPYFTILAVGQGITTSSGALATASASSSGSAASAASSDASSSDSASAASASASGSATDSAASGSSTGSATGSSTGSATGSSTGSATGSSSASATSSKASSNAASVPTGGLVAFAAAGLGAAVALL